MRRLLVLGGFVAAHVACSPLAHTWDPVEEFPIERARRAQEPAPAPDVLRVLTWNVKFGGGRIDFFFDGFGDRVHMTEREVDDNLDAVVGLLGQQGPDVILLQEVDRGSKRSAFVDQAVALLDDTDANWLAWVPNWHVDFIPEEGLGRMETGQAVLSRYPITRNTRVDLPQAGQNSALVNYFWLHRCIQIVEIDVGAGRVLTVLNNHPTAYSLDGTKQIHLQRILTRAARARAPLVVGGDLNVIPPGSLRTRDFADEADVDTTGVTAVTYSDDEMAALNPFYDVWAPVVRLEDYQAAQTEEEQSRWLSHSVSGDVFWTQKLDYLFTTETWAGGWTLQQPGDGDPPVVADPMQLSDHAPVVGDLVLP